MHRFLILMLALVSCTPGPDQTVTPAPVPIDGRDSIIGSYRGEIYEAQKYWAYDTIKNSWEYLIDDTVYPGICQVAIRGKDSFVITIKPGLTDSTFYQYLPGKRSYSFQWSSHSGAAVDIIGDSISYTSGGCTGYNSTCWEEKFNGKK